MIRKGGREADGILFGKYRLEQVIGRGRRGTVYLARHIALDEPRAVKRVPRPDSAVLREARLLRRIRMPDIPILYDLETDSTYYYLIEQYLDGESLSSRIQRTGRLHEAELIPIGIRLCRILLYLHSLYPPIYYTDLQPENILLCGNGPKLVDFDSAVSEDVTPEGEVRGTPGFSAPELEHGHRPDQRTDIYGLGAVLRYMLTGGNLEKDMPGESPGKDACGISRNPPGSPELQSLIRSCLLERPEERPQSAEEVLNILLTIGARPQKMDHPLIRAAVCESSRGAGATGFCFRMAKSLGRQGIRCLIREENQTGAMIRFADYLGEIPDSYGIFHALGCAVKPYYGSCVHLAETPSDMAAEDFGTELQSVRESDADVKILFCRAEPWQMPDSVRAVRMLSRERDLRIVFAGGAARPVLPAELTRLSYYQMPAGSDAAAEDSFFRELLAGSRAGELFGRSGETSRTAGPGENGRRRGGAESLLRRLTGRERGR
jgi:tRNA A-37 threonylcarbamoyl transferase component Bud32